MYGTIGIYSIIYSVYTLIFVGLIPPIILCIFGYLTYCNMRDIHNRVRSIVNHDISLRRRDRELMVIVISEVFFYIITTSPYPIIVLEMMISRYVISNKTIQYSQIESFIFTIAFLLLFVNNTAPFYIYLIVSKSFRRNFKQLFIDFYGKLRRNETPVQIIPRRY
jgi:TM2 domain-containing membrane protein YozV